MANEDGPGSRSAEREKRIAERAHHLWEREGCPHGRDRAHWEEARRQIDLEDGAPLPSGGIADQSAADDASLTGEALAETARGAAKPRRRKA